MPEPAEGSASRRVGRYTLRSLLGRGGMGEVYQAYDERLRRHVAIKRIRAADGDDPQRRARFEQEARLLAQLVHPAIVQVFDIFDDETGDWVVMELVEGSTLAALLEQGPISVDDVLRHGHAIAAGLDAAHRQGIIHRDLKVENVMLSKTGQIKILDFGLAKRSPGGDASSAALSIEGQVLGTVRAMSPEQARGLAVDERSDLFSLGVLLYEMLAGVTPFAGETPLVTLLRVTTDRQASLVELPGMAARIPPALSELVDQLLEKAAELRPASATEVRDRLQTIAASRPRAASGGVPAVERTPESSGPHPGGTELRAQETEVSSSDLAATWRPARDRAIETASTAVLVPPAARVSPPVPRRRRRRLLLVGLGAGLAAAVITVWAGALRPSAVDASLTAPVAATPSSAVPRDTPTPSRDPRAEYDRGMALLRDPYRPGVIDTAVGIFQRLLRDNEGSAAAYAGLARAYWLRYSFTDESQDTMYLQQAKAAADRAVALDEFLVDGRVSHGLAVLELGQVADAERDFQAALALDGKSADAYHGLALLRQHQQRLDDAEAAFRKAIELAPAERDLYDDLGGLLVQRGKYQDAIPLLEKSIALAPDSPYGYSNLGAVYLLQGRYEDAAQRFQDALKIRPSSSLYSNLGTVLFAQGLYGPAASAFERSLAMGGAANSPVHWGNLADAYRQLPDAADKAREAYDHAIGLLDAELARSPQDLTLRSRRVLYLAKRGDCPRAGDGLAAMGDARDAPAYALFRMAVALEVCGQRQRAIAMLERALASGFSPAEIGNDPELRALRADPGYHRMLDRRVQPSVTPTSRSN